MTLTIHLALLIAALITFAAATVVSTPRVNLLALASAFFVASFIW